jgi:hypothetical protein
MPAKRKSTGIIEESLLRKIQRERLATDEHK